MIPAQLHLRIAFVMICIGWTMQVIAGDTGAPQKNGRIQLLESEILSQEPGPFLEYSDPVAIEAQLRQPVEQEVAAASATVAPELLPAVASVTELVVPENRHAARSQLRDDLLQEGKSSVTQQDDLTSEFFSVMRWTLVALVVGGVGAMSLKRLPQFKTPSVSGNKMKIIETLPLGRNQNLNLIQAGGERFLIASDPGGIKSVTLLPNWPDTDQEIDETHITDVPPAKSITSRFAMFEKSQSDTRAA